MSNGTSIAANALKKKVAVIGGGPAGIATAFWLTSTQALRDRFEVAVYTPGWRLGGKCASGRNMEQGGRIEEHGLHVLMGCYQHAFSTIRACYAEWQPRAAGPFQNWQQAFTEQYQISLQERASSSMSSEWSTWNFELPQRSGLPGDSLVTPTGDCPWDPSPPSLMADLLESLADWLFGHVSTNIPQPHWGGVELDKLISRFKAAVQSPLAEEFEDLVAEFDKLGDSIRVGIESTPPLTATGAPAPTHCDTRCAHILAELGLTVARGWLADVVLAGQTLDHLNALDFRAWLRIHHASASTLASAPIRALYDLTFAFRNGDSHDINNGSIAAGVTLRFALEASLGYKRAPLWKMNAGTGDALFTPFYQVLQARGVAVNFFHRLTRLELTGDATRIGKIALDQQVLLKSGRYDPFVLVDNLDCWPSHPQWSQLVDGDVLQQKGVDLESPADTTVQNSIELNEGTDFDVAVLAVPPDVFTGPASGLSGRDPNWDAMVAHATSVATEAFQLWLKPDLTALGWTLGPTVLGAFAEPFDSWADMSHLLPRESWPSGNAPKSIEFFCGCLKEPPPPPNPYHDAQTWLAQNISVLWPQASLPNDVVSGYYRANMAGSERYVQTPADTVRFRLSSDSPVFGNLYITGDWTLTRFSGGCFEAAMESGMLAAAGICGRH